MAQQKVNTFNIFVAIIANCIWGIAFLIPYVLSKYNSVLISIGRYLVYGMITLTIFPFTVKNYKSFLKKQYLKTALLFAFTGNIGYYCFLVLAIDNIGVAITALIIGTLPITMAIYGNILNREYSFKKMIAPIILILFGLSVLNLMKYGNVMADNTEEIYSIFPGILYAIIALGMWTWFGVANANFLKTNREISASSWSTFVGIATLFIALIGLPFLYFIAPAAIGQIRNNINIAYLLPLLAGCLILGVVVSWLATILWNKASRDLPVTLAGQLIVFETISSILYSYIVDKKVPMALEVISMLFIIAGILLAIRTTQKATIGAELENNPAGCNSHKKQREAGRNEGWHLR